MTLAALGVFLMFFIIMVAVSGMDHCVVSSIREVGLGNTVVMMMGAVGFIVIFIASLWILYGLGFE